MYIIITLLWSLHYDMLSDSMLCLFILAKGFPHLLLSVWHILAEPLD